MKKIILTLSILLVVLLALINQSIAQSKDETSKVVDDLNRAIDQAVVNRNIAILQKHLGEDFVFTHGGGGLDSKESWIKKTQNLTDSVRFASRDHDSTHVELHGNIAIVTGKLSVVHQSKQEVSKYSLRYVRVFALRNKVWQMISNYTTQFWNQ